MRAQVLQTRKRRTAGKCRPFLTDLQLELQIRHCCSSAWTHSPRWRSAPATG